MPVLVRKLDKRQNAELIKRSNSIENIPADVISRGEFKTTDNTLSVWETPDDNPELGILAVLLSQDHIESIDFILLSKEFLEASGLTLEATTPTNNPLLEAKNIHRDIKDLCLKDFTKLALVYKNAVDADTNVFRISKPEFKNKIKQAYKNGWIDIDLANEKIQQLIDEIK